MAQLRKSTPQAATVAISKSKSTAAGGAGPTDAHPSHLDVHIKDVGGEHSFPVTASEAGINGHETRLLTEGQLLQMLASLQRQLNKQWAEAARECEKDVL